jgi:hypothetical protein
MGVDVAAVLRQRLETIQRWKEAENALKRERERTLAAWDEQDLQLVEAAKRALVGWKEPYSTQLVSCLRLELVMSCGQVRRYVAPHHYEDWGFIGSPDSCRRWEDIPDIQRDFESVQEMWANLFIMRLEERKIYVTERSRRARLRCDIGLLGWEWDEVEFSC